MALRKRLPLSATTMARPISFPGPIGGWNARDPLAEMAPAPIDGTGDRALSVRHCWEPFFGEWSLNFAARLCVGFLCLLLRASDVG